MADYSKQRNKAIELIASKGSPVTFVKSSGRVDPITGFPPSTPGLSTQVNAVFTSVDKKLIPESRITATSRMMIIGSDYEPSVNENVIVKGKTFSVSGVYPVAPDVTQTILYKVLIDG